MNIYDQVTTSSFEQDDVEYKYLVLNTLENIEDIPYCLRIIIENILRKKSLQLSSIDISSKTVPIYPQGVVYNDYSCLPALIDLAYMRNALQSLNKNPSLVQPVCSVSVVMDHMVDNVKIFTDRQQNGECPFHKNIKLYPILGKEVLTNNQKMELERNREKLSFLKWASKSFEGLKVLPPSSAALHQPTLERICPLVTVTNGYVHLATVLSNDSHILSLNALGQLAMEVGSVELEGVVLGQPFFFKVPKVVGCRILGGINKYVTSTDIVLAITKTLKKQKLANVIVEFFGSGVKKLSISERMSISGMSHEYSFIGYFPPDRKTIEYLYSIGCKDVLFIEKYLKLSLIFNESRREPLYEQVIEVDLDAVVPHCSCLGIPKERVPINLLQQEFRNYLKSIKQCQGCNCKEDEIEKLFRDGLIVSASVSSCTNSTNSLVMLAAGLLAKKAVARGLKLQSYTHATVQPGPGMALHYLLRTNCHDYLQKLGFKMIGPNCAECAAMLNNENEDTNISNDVLKISLYSSLPTTLSSANKCLPTDVSASSTPIRVTKDTAPSTDKSQPAKCVAMTTGCVAKENDVLATKCVTMKMTTPSHATVIMSPLHVILYAIAANLDFNLNEGLKGSDNTTPISDIWPTREEIEELESSCVLSTIQADIEERLLMAEQWNKSSIESVVFNWNSSSTNIVQPDYLHDFNLSDNRLKDICNARVLVYLGDNISTDFISPAGCIARTTPAGHFLMEKNLMPRQFDSYGARRGNFEVMARGTLSHAHLRNLLLSQAGPKTMFFPTSTVMDIYDASAKYRMNKVPLIILAGKNFGCGALREWAARGLESLGVTVVIAESFSESYRQSLIAFGILPLVMIPPLPKLTGREIFNIPLTNMKLQPNQVISVEAGKEVTFKAVIKCETELECEYASRGGQVKHAVTLLCNRGQ